MKIYARNYNVVCEPYKPQNQTSNSLLIDISNSNNIAKIIDIDPIYDDCAYDCGDIIVYDEQYAIKCVLCGKEYIIVGTSDIYATIKEDE